MAKGKYQYCVVLSTAPDQAVAEKLADGLVKEKLAACVNMVPGLTSVYVWKGDIQKDKEVLLIIKTRAALADPVCQYIKSHHGAEVPEAVALPIVAGSGTYLNWVAANTISTRLEDDTTMPI